MKNENNHTFYNIQLTTKIMRNKIYYGKKIWNFNSLAMDKYLNQQHTFGLFLKDKA